MRDTSSTGGSRRRDGSPTASVGESASAAPSAAGGAASSTACTSTLAGSAAVGSRSSSAMAVSRPTPNGDEAHRHRLDAHAPSSPSDPRGCSPSALLGVVPPSTFSMPVLHAWPRSSGIARPSCSDASPTAASRCLSSTIAARGSSRLSLSPAVPAPPAAAWTAAVADSADGVVRGGGTDGAADGAVNERGATYASTLDEQMGAGAARSTAIPADGAAGSAQADVLSSTKRFACWNQLRCSELGLTARAQPADIARLSCRAAPASADGRSDPQPEATGLVEREASREVRREPWRDARVEEGFDEGRDGARPPARAPGAAAPAEVRSPTALTSSAE